MTADNSAADFRLEREAVTVAINEVLQRARAGRGGALFVVGEAGLGKTTCLELAQELARDGIKVGLGGSNAIEASRPFGLIGRAIQALGGPDTADPGSDQWAGDIRAERYYGVLRWLESVGDEPLLLALDDLHWADPDSLALLSFLSRRIETLPVAIVGTMRPWPAEAAEMASHLMHDVGARVERLAPLSEDATHELLAARLGGGPIEDEVGATVWRLCAGNPLLVEHVAHAIAAGEQLTPRAERLTTGELLLTRFAGLSAAGLQCAQAACVLAGRFRPEVAAEVAQLDADETAVALEALWRSGLVSEQSEQWVEFTHALFCQALYDELSPELRTELHARAFAVLAGRGDTTAAAEHAVRADLVGDPAAVDVLGQAGRTALRSGAPATGAGHLRAAVRFAADQAPADLVLTFGEALLASGQLAEMLAVCEPLRDRADIPATQRADVLRMMGRAHFVMGRYATAGELYEAAADLTETHDPAAAVETLLEDALASWTTAGPARSLPLVTRARELSRLAPAVVRRRTEVAYRYVATQAGVPDAQAAGETATDEVDAAVHPSEMFRTGVLNAYVAQQAERFADARQFLEIALSMAEQVGAVTGIALLSLDCAALYYRTGPLPRALAHARRAATLADLMPAAESYAGFSQAAILLQLGEVDESERWCAAVEPRATERGEGLALLWVWYVRAQRLLREGRQTEACELYDRLEELTGRMGFRDPCLVAWPRHAVEARLAAGRRDDAARLVGWLAECADPLPGSWPRIAAETTAAMLAEFDGDHDRADVLFRTGLARHQDGVLPLEKVETLIAYGSFLRRRDRQTDARPLLAQALDLAEANGAGWLAEHAAALLLAAGGRRRRTRNAANLTLQEQRVAKLATEGYSNKEIAEALTLSVKTIEFHLQRVYAKLGINSRRQLMTMTARDAARPAAGRRAT